MWKLDVVWYYWSCFAVAAEALALWDEKAVFDVVEIQSKQGNWEIIQVVEKIETLIQNGEVLCNVALSC